MFLLIHAHAAHLSLARRKELSHVTEHFSAGKLPLLDLVILQINSASDAGKLRFDIEKSVIFPILMLGTFDNQILVAVSINLGGNLDLGELFDGVNFEW